MKLKTVFSPPILKNKIEPANLDPLPIAQSWPKDGGPFITFPLVLTKSPVDGRQNMGVYRMQKFSSTQTGLHWQIAKGGGYHYQQAEKQNQNLPVAAVVGADPLLMMGGVLPLPEGMDEMAFMGFLRGEGTKVTHLKNSDLTVPAEAEFILEGVAPPHETRTEGPYGDHFGHYSHEAPFPVFHVDRIWHRDKPLFPIAVVGKPPQEDQVLGDAVQEIFLPLLKVMHPEVSDLWAYQEAGFHNLIVASVHQRFPKEALKTALWILGEGQLALSKCVILVDPEVNARDFNSVLRALKNNFSPQNDFTLLPATSQDTLDFTSTKMNLGSKMILDATAKSPVKKPDIKLDLNRLQERDSRILQARFIEETLLVVQTPAEGRDLLEKMSGWPDLKNVPLIAAVSPDVPLNDPTLLIWGIFTRFDCARDTFFGSVKLRGGHPVYEGPLCIDATWKKGYPEPLEMDPAIVKKVDQRWKEYGVPSKARKPEVYEKELSHSY